MLWLLYTVLVLHIASAAAWFGHKLLVPADLRRSLSGAAVAEGLLSRVEAAQRLGIGSGLATLTTGLVLIHLSGGFGEMPLRIHLGLALVIVMFVLGATLARPAWNRVRAAIPDNLGEARKSARVLAGVLIVEQVLWLAALGTMVVKR
jgi:hypothetical protein